jgi:hypothetical protein
MMQMPQKKRRLALRRIDDPNAAASTTTGQYNDSLSGTPANRSAVQQGNALSPKARRRRTTGSTAAAATDATSGPKFLEVR